MRFRAHVDHSSFLSQVGDYALIKVIRKDTKFECFVPATIIAVPQMHSDDKLYTVVIYSGQKVCFVEVWFVQTLFQVLLIDPYLGNCIFTLSYCKDYIKKNGCDYINLVSLISYI